MMLEREVQGYTSDLRVKINQNYRISEIESVQERMEQAALSEEQVAAIKIRVTDLVQQMRTARKNSLGIDSFLSEYALSSEEGIALMCLAEAFLRVPDKSTRDGLIKDKLLGMDWNSHKGHSRFFFVNAATWALMLTGKVLTPQQSENKYNQIVMKLVNRVGEGVVRSAIETAMHIMSRQFVMGRTIQEAVSRAKKKEAQGYRYSYDMLGESALTAKDAERHLVAYKNGIGVIGASVSPKTSIDQRASISIKLSAIHPRYQESQHDRVLNELSPKLLELAQLAKAQGIALTVDAEESEILDLSLDIIEAVFNHPSLEGWDGFGIALQSYQKRAFYVLDWLADLARKKQRRIMVRLIKGAYWDTEIKKTQMQGLKEYPVFTRKVFTDVSFQACAKKILTMTDAIYPQFGTHNAYSVAMILEIVGDYKDFEFQCLHGMGDELYTSVVASGIPCRIYAPVGTHEDLLPYLVRRILENGANSSFVNRVVDDHASMARLVENPLKIAAELIKKNNEKIPLPEAIMPGRKNSQGFDWSDRQQRALLKTQLDTLDFTTLCTGHETVISPQHHDRVVGTVKTASPDDIETALMQSESVFKVWSETSVEERANCLERFAANLEKNRAELLALLCLEAGKTWHDASAELREAVDFCYYYATMAKQLMQTPTMLPGYTGELNWLTLHPRGTMLCISPWNFPLAIFTGQVVAALVTGNCVIAKPAEQTPFIANLAIRLLHEAGVPSAVVQLLAGTGEAVGEPLVADKRIKGVIFTGSTETARRINQTLAQRMGEIIPLIAETGGQNAMIVDSSALLEQVVTDVIISAFGSAGQRCSALRVLYLQEAIYEQTLDMLKGAMEELNIGDPCWLSTDIGPVIDENALTVLKQHVLSMQTTAKIVYQCTLPESCHDGYYMPPTVIAIPDISVLKREIFGPILHVISFKSEHMDSVIDQINSTQYGLTLGIHSRINERVNYIQARVCAGNCYVNRNMIGAVVGLQPFGGEGLSGTGPKAGGPHYLSRLCLERTFTVNTTAAGGNASLMALPEDDPFNDNK